MIYFFIIIQIMHTLSSIYTELSQTACREFSPVFTYFTVFLKK
ncbi:hypothetical protein HMPREF1548_02743 [Clostridium sp. KLE 1755]|nr:hypothetical protein HMPREF1548_02743 [Clostridium sp. KLE 1755]